MAVKARYWQILGSVLALWMLLGLLSCGGSPVKPKVMPPSPLMGMTWSLDSPEKGPRKLWSHEVGGLITDLGIARNGAAIVVATAPDPEVPGSGTKRHVQRYGRGGRLEWRVELASALRTLDVTDNAGLVLASSYDSEVFALGAKGRKLWSVEAVCKPVAFSRERVLCYHDDDAEPHVAFDVLNDRGKKLASVSIEELLDPNAGKPVRVDILALEVSDDLKSVAVALTGGRVIFLNEELKPMWRAQVDGEVLNLAVADVAPASGPRVAVLANLPLPAASEGELAPQRLTLLNAQGQFVTQGAPPVHVEQLEFAMGGLMVYGNSQAGQYLGRFEWAPQSGDALVEKWRKGDARVAEYSSNFVVTPGAVVLGFEEQFPSGRRPRLAAFGADGAAKWSLPITVGEGAYYYTQVYASSAKVLAVVTDDGVLHAFSLAEGAASAKGK